MKGIQNTAIVVLLFFTACKSGNMVKEENIRKAIYYLWTKDGQIVEGAGAAVVSALLENPQLCSGGKTVAIITGGNIEDSVLSEILTSEKLTMSTRNENGSVPLQ